MTREVKTVVLIEPDVWRFSGIARFLVDAGLQVVAGSALLDEPGSAADAVLLAMTVVKRHGRDVVNRMRRAYPFTGILVYGETECLDATASLLTLGVHGYFGLSTPQPRLLEALRVVAAGGIWAPRQAVMMMAQRVVRAADLDSEDGEERHFLEMLMEGLSNKEIAARLGIAEVTVKARLTRLYKRHGVRTRLQLLSSAIRQRLIGAEA